jgi:hypothetical protein
MSLIASSAGSCAAPTGLGELAGLCTQPFRAGLKSDAPTVLMSCDVWRVERARVRVKRTGESACAT